MKKDQITSFVPTRNAEIVYFYQFSYTHTRFPRFVENVLKISATFSVSDIILTSSLNMTLLVPTILFEKFVLSTLQKFLLSFIM